MNDTANNTPNPQPLARVVNLLDPSRNVIYGMSQEQATAIAPYNTTGLCDPERRNIYPIIGAL